MDNCKIELIEKYIFPDGTSFLDKDKAKIYDEYYSEIFKLNNEVISFINKEVISTSNEYDLEIKNYDKFKVEEFKKRYYIILQNIYHKYENYKYDTYFDYIIKEPLFDIYGGLRCISNIPEKLELVISLGTVLISFHFNGMKFKSFAEKCIYIDEVDSKL